MALIKWQCCTAGLVPLPPPPATAVKQCYHAMRCRAIARATRRQGWLAPFPLLLFPARAACQECVLCVCVCVCRVQAFVSPVQWSVRSGLGERSAPPSPHFAALPCLATSGGIAKPGKTLASVTGTAPVAISTTMGPSQQSTYLSPPALTGRVESGKTFREDD